MKATAERYGVTAERHYQNIWCEIDVKGAWHLQRHFSGVSKHVTLKLLRYFNFSHGEGPCKTAIVQWKGFELGPWNTYEVQSLNALNECSMKNLWNFQAQTAC